MSWTPARPARRLRADAACGVEIDALDRRIVAPAQRARRARAGEVGRAKAPPAGGPIRDAEREREVLLRVTMANAGRSPRPTCWRSTAGSSPRPAALEAATEPGRGRRRRRPDRDGATLDPPTRRLPARPTTRLRAGADRLPAPRPRRQRDLRLGPRPGDRRPRRAPDRGPRPAALPARSTRRRCSTTSTWLGFGRRPPGPSAQARIPSRAAYAAALDRLRAAGLVYACDCTRSTFAAWAREPRSAMVTGRAVRAAAASGAAPRPGARACGSRSGTATETLDGPAARAAVAARSASGGDLPSATGTATGPTRLRVVVDDLRQAIDLVVRGEDLVERDRRRRSGSGGCSAATVPPAFAHHPLDPQARTARKLSKADGDTAVPRAAGCRRARPRRDRRGGGRGRTGGRTARPIRADDVGRLFAAAQPPVRVRSSISQAWSSACQAIRRAA